jgi:hypothetical protein
VRKKRSHDFYAFANMRGDPRTLFFSLVSITLAFVVVAHHRSCARWGRRLSWVTAQEPQEALCRHYGVSAVSVRDSLLPLVRDGDRVAQLNADHEAAGAEESVACTALVGRGFLFPPVFFLFLVLSFFPSRSSHRAPPPPSSPGSKGGKHVPLSAHHAAFASAATLSGGLSGGGAEDAEVGAKLKR